ncbi:DUF3108 domain-containing protein [Candidatus Avelusimicrobium sp.]|uniref:DUF3108 domain-containing protein n=1 Tax=Candidatus Avelusimicrobium sp. TaxID=3048833 RepID=UPI003D7D3FE1
MANKSLCALFAAVFLLCACAHKQAESTAQKVISAPLLAEAKPASSEKASTQTTAPATPTKTVLSATAQPEQTLNPQPEKEPAITPESRVGQARKQQVLSSPTPDEKSFEGEELISLEGRRLSPLAYTAVSPEKTSAAWSGEELKYGLYYSFIKAGTAYIKNRGVTTANGRKAYLIQTTAFSASVIDAFFKVRDVNYSWIDAENFYSLGYTQSVREGNYKRDEWLTFDYDNKVYYGEVQKKEAPRVLSGALSQRVLDMLSSLYFVRAQTLTKGQDIIFDIINREKQYPLVVKVLGKETVKTAAGKFDCIVVEPQFRGEGIFVSKGKSLKVWLTDDAYKMPVKMKTEVFIGSVSAELLEYKRN